MNIKDESLKEFIGGELLEFRRDDIPTSNIKYWWDKYLAQRFNDFFLSFDVPLLYVFVEGTEFIPEQIFSNMKHIIERLNEHK